MKRFSQTCAAIVFLGLLSSCSTTGEKAPEQVGERTTSTNSGSEKKADKKEGEKKKPEKKKFNFNEELQKERDRRHKES